MKNASDAFKEVNEKRKKGVLSNIYRFVRLDLAVQLESRSLPRPHSRHLQAVQSLKKAKPLKII